MLIKFRDQLPDLMQVLYLPLTCALIGVHNGMFANILMSKGLERLYLVDEWKDSQQMDDTNMHEYYDNDLLVTRNKMSIYDNRTEQYIILQGTSAEIAPHINNSSVSMVYIDQQTSGKTDIDDWYPKLVQGGILAFSNYNDIQEHITLWLADNNYKLSDIIIIPEYGNSGAYIIKH